MAFVRRTSIKEQIYIALRNKIMNQEFHLGEKINMLSLEQEFGVSNTPIREALTMLERDGLVETRPNTGSRVVQFTPAFFKTVAEAVEALIIGAYFICLYNNKIPQLADKLQETYDAQAAAVECDSAVEFAKVTMNFDASFLDVCGNEKLQSNFHDLFDLFYLAILIDHQNNGDQDRSSHLDEHIAILDAVRGGNTNLVCALIHKHFDRTMSFPK